MTRDRLLELAKQVLKSLPDKHQLSVGDTFGFLFVPEVPIPEHRASTTLHALAQASVNEEGHHQITRGDALCEFGEDAARFVLAHEYAYIALGHVLFGRCADLPDVYYQNEHLKSLSFASEAIADFYAITVQLYVAASKSPRNCG